MKVQLMVHISGEKLTPLQFREKVGARTHEFLGTVVDRYNDTVRKEEKAIVILDKNVSERKEEK